MADLHIRPAREADLAVVGELTLAAYRDDGLLDSESYGEVLRDAESRYREAELLVAVAADDTGGMDGSGETGGAGETVGADQAGQTGGVSQAGGAGQAGGTGGSGGMGGSGDTSRTGEAGGSGEVGGLSGSGRTGDAGGTGSPGGPGSTGGPGEVLGTVTVVLPGTPYSEVSAPGEIEFRMLAVSRSARGRGVGEALVRAVFDRARAVGASRVVLSSSTHMLAAHRLYERLGFVRQPERDWSPLPGVELVAYTCPV